MALNPFNISNVVSEAQTVNKSIVLVSFNNLND